MKYNCEIRQKLNSGIYEILVNERIIGTRYCKFTAKRFLKKFLKNNCLEHKSIYTCIVGDDLNDNN